MFCNIKIVRGSRHDNLVSTFCLTQCDPFLKTLSNTPLRPFHDELSHLILLPFLAKFSKGFYDVFVMVIGPSGVQFGL